jgi:hypothetical protein
MENVKGSGRVQYFIPTYYWRIEEQYEMPQSQWLDWGVENETQDLQYVKEW